MKTAHGSQRGSVMLEALVSILLFSIGILALVGLQAVSVKNSSEAKYRTDASLLANEVIGKMWVSDKAALSNFSSPSGSSYTAWLTTVANTLPGVSAGTNAPTITITDRTATITVFWQLPGETQTHQYTAIATVN